MGVSLAVVAEEAVETLLVRIALRPGVAEPPFAEGAAGVALCFQALGDGDIGGKERVLSLGLHRGIVAHGGVAGMFAGHEDTARGSADGVARIGAGEFHPRSGERVDAWRLDFFLSVAAEFAIPEIVREDEDDVGLFGGGEDCRGQEGASEEQTGFHQGNRTPDPATP